MVEGENWFPQIVLLPLHMGHRTQAGARKQAGARRQAGAHRQAGARRQVHAQVSIRADTLRMHSFRLTCGNSSMELVHVLSRELLGHLQYFLSDTIQLTF